MPDEHPLSVPASVRGERTGRYLVSYPGADSGPLTAALKDRAGLRTVTTSTDLRDVPAGQEPPEVMLFPHLSAAVLTGDPDQMADVAQACTDLQLAGPEPERWVYRSSHPLVDGELADYLRGYRDGVASVVDRLVGAPPAPGTCDDAAGTGLTWGLQSIGIAQTAFTGRGVRVAVLDTGLDSDHPDLGSRAVAAASFVAGEGTEDVQGHGTHCAGTLCGPRTPHGLVRYGVAPDVELLVGKVLGDDGKGREGDVLAGIDWAVEQGCRVVSMSLGSRAVPGERYSVVFEQVAAALAAATPGVVLVAAAGNDSARRRGRVAPVGRPASSPSVVAVAAVDPQLAVADFSNAGGSPSAGQVDVAGPGVDVLSAFPAPEGPYRQLSGTSMATPHVAGVLALLAERHPEAGVPQLVSELARSARRLPASSLDVGAGLVQAPA